MKTISILEYSFLFCLSPEKILSKSSYTFITMIPSTTNDVFCKRPRVNSVYNVTNKHINKRDALTNEKEYQSDSTQYIGMDIRYRYRFKVMAECSVGFVVALEIIQGGLITGCQLRPFADLPSNKAVCGCKKTSQVLLFHFRFFFFFPIPKHNLRV